MNATRHVRLLGTMLVVGMSFPALPAFAAPNGEREPEARVQPGNYCLGGIEDRKIIVGEGQLTDPFEQTTRLGCEVDGGEAHVMPDLPAPSPVRRLLA